MSLGKYKQKISCLLMLIYSCFSSTPRFDSSVAPLIYADQFIKFSSRLSSPLVYGLGEHRQSLAINVTEEWKKLTFWSRDFPPVQNTNLYGE